MKKLLFVFAVLCAGRAAQAQSGITLTGADMPAYRDTLRYSNTDPGALPNGFRNGGANLTWNYSSFPSTRQAVDTYRRATEVNSSFTNVSSNAYGTKVADTLQTGGAATPAPITNVYQYYEIKTAPASFSTVAISANFLQPTAVNYSDPDEQYFFPLSYNRTDSSTFAFSYSIPFVASIKESGTRRTKADAWGTMYTPYYTAGISVLRVRTEVVQHDTLTYNGTATPVTTHTVEYIWRANGVHFPVMDVVCSVDSTGNETPYYVAYRDRARTTAVAAAAPAQPVGIYPNPATDRVHLQLPTAWTSVRVELFDKTGRLCYSGSERDFSVSQLAPGDYFIKASSGGETVFLRLLR